MPEQDYLVLLNLAIQNLFHDAVRISFKNPRRLCSLLLIMGKQRKAAQLRNYWLKQNVSVPPFAILSVTNQCNLKCQGCYARTHQGLDSSTMEMSKEKLSSILEEAQELGISIILLAGGEPLTRPEILAVTKGFPKLIFPLFTNGLLLDETKVRELTKQPHVVPVISMEGYQDQTDGRRGVGVFQGLLRSFSYLHKAGILFGASLTITRKNFAEITAESFVQELLRFGCKLFFYVEYIPVQPGTEDLVLSEDQRTQIVGLMAAFRSRYPGLFIAFPGDEEKFGGCLAAGRGFIHINAKGDLEPCPFAPFSDRNLERISLREALQSDLLKLIRENADELKETEGGCALWNKREWLRSLGGSKEIKL